MTPFSDFALPTWCDALSLLFYSDLLDTFPATGRSARRRSRSSTRFRLIPYVFCLPSIQSESVPVIEGDGDFSRADRPRSRPSPSLSTVWRCDKQVWFSLQFWQPPSGGDGGLNLSTLCPATVTTVLLQAVLGGGAVVSNVSLVFDLSISDQNRNCVIFLDFLERCQVFNKPWVAKMFRCYCVLYLQFKKKERNCETIVLVS